MATDVNAWGTSQNAPLPGVGIGAGVRSPFGTIIPPGSNVIYLRSTGKQDRDTYDVNKRLVTTLSAALAQCRSGLGDTIIVLPGHSESVADATMLTNLVAGTRIIGFGNGSNMPVFRWTATASQWVLNKADVYISGLRLRLEGANGVVKALAVTGADVTIDSCDIEMGSGASNKATIGIEYGSGADRFVLCNNRIRGAVAGAVTDGILVAAAVDGGRILNNKMMFAGTTTNGNVRVTAAATDLEIGNNVLNNSVASSVACINFSNVAVTGSCYGNFITVLSTGAVSAGVTGITVGGTNNLIGFHQNFAVNDPNKSGFLAPAVDT